MFVFVVSGMDVTLVVNNLGGTSYLELYLVANSAVRYLGKANFALYSLHNIIVVGINLGLYIIIVDRLKVNVVRVYVGTLMTSLEMAGVSLTLLQTPSQWVELLGKLWVVN